MSETHRSLSYVYLKKKTSLGHADSFLVFCYSRTKRLQNLVIIRVFDLEIRLSEVATLEKSCETVFLLRHNDVKRYKDEINAVLFYASRRSF